MNLVSLVDLSPKKLVFIIVVAVVVVVLGVVIFGRITSHNHLKKKVSDLSKRYDYLHELLTVQLDKDIKRVYSISQENVEYESTYNMYNNMYQDVVHQEDSIAQKAVNDISKLLTEKKYKQVKEELDSVKAKIVDLEKKCNVVSSSVSEIINVDDDNRQEILRYRRDFREVKEEYESKKNELRFIESSFVSVFEKVEEYFSESERLLAGAHYVESKEKFPEIDRVIKALKKSIGLLPKLCTLSFVVVPNSIDELTGKYNKMLSEGYPLHHLQFQSLVESFNQTLDDIHFRLGNFKMNNIEYELNQIRDAIIKVSNDLDSEISSKNYFKNSYKEIYNGSYRLENKFIKLRRDIPKYKETYLLKDSCVDDLERIQVEINELGTIKRTLDTYVHSSSSQPYSVLSKRLKDLDDAMNQIENDINSIHLYLNSLKEDTNVGYKYVTDTYIELKKYESLLRRIDVQSVSFSFNSGIKQCYEILMECGSFLSNLPIDVASLNDDIAKLKVCFDGVVSKISTLEDDMCKAEQAVVYANQYRQGFDDVKTTLLRAEKSFFEGDFTRTSDETVAMLKKIRPDSGK